MPGPSEGVAREHPGERVEPWFMDQARVGQKGRLTHVWYRKKGVRPRGPRRQGFAAAHRSGAVRPERGEGVAPVLPEVSTAAMGVFLAEPARTVPAGSHAALVPGGAGWPVSEERSVPADLTPIHPPPCSPALNPLARVREYRRDRRLSHRVLAGGHEAVVDAAWNAPRAEPGWPRSLTHLPWLPASLTIRRAGITRVKVSDCHRRRALGSAVPVRTGDRPRSRPRLGIHAAIEEPLAVRLEQAKALLREPSSRLDPGRRHPDRLQPLNDAAMSRDLQFRLHDAPFEVGEPRQPRRQQGGERVSQDRFRARQHHP